MKWSHNVISTAHVKTNGEIIWTSLGDDIDSTDVSVKESFMIHSGIIHADDRLLVAKITKSGVVYLNVPWRVLFHHP